MLEFMSGDFMKCTWYLKKRYKINHRWAYRAARLLTKLPGQWDWVVRKPDAPSLSWTPENKLRILDYFNCCLTWSEDTQLHSVLNEAVSRLKKNMESDTKFSISNLADIAEGFILYLVVEYYWASREYTDTKILSDIIKQTNRTGSEIHIPSWGD